ncbi:MAG TPA: hypothetical protein VHS31_04965 [Tepidisphaeraceae bacterium]|jgi:hypothetical protein|nr:hypothetical protein [Tepidisphaeraceae bacterium]
MDDLKQIHRTERMWGQKSPAEDEGVFAYFKCTTREEAVVLVLPEVSWPKFKVNVIARIVENLDSVQADITRQMHALPHSAIIDDKTVHFQSTEEKFFALAAIWRRHIRGRSIVNYSHPAYFQIMTMGRAVVPFLLQDVARGVGTWYVALQSILNVSAESPDARGDAAAVRKAWIDWGKRNGYWIELAEAQRNY